MAVLRFPPVEEADEYGILAVGGDLEVSTLLLAYRSGIFPWPLFGEKYLTWFAPEKRAVLFLDEFHIGRSLRRELSRADYRIEVNKDFEQVIKSCSELKNRGDQPGTWITDAMVGAYIDLHQAGFCHSIECSFEGELAGGLYGVAINRMFAGESMFYRKPNASKIALCFLVEYLRVQKVQWIDCQYMTPLFRSFGAREIPRSEFMTLLNDALADDVELFR